MFIVNNSAVSFGPVGTLPIWMYFTFFSENVYQTDTRRISHNKN